MPSASPANVERLLTCLARRQIADLRNETQTALAALNAQVAALDRALQQEVADREAGDVALAVKLGNEVARLENVRPSRAGLEAPPWGACDGCGSRRRHCCCFACCRHYCYCRNGELASQ